MSGKADRIRQVLNKRTREEKRGTCDEEFTENVHEMKESEHR